MTANALFGRYLRTTPSAIKILRVALSLAFTAIVVGANAGNKPKPVTVAPIQDIYIYPAKDAPATVVSPNDAKVSAEAPGVLNAFAVEVGDQVRSGQLIASLNCEEHEINAESATADLKAAESRMAFAKTQLASAKKLSSIKSIAKEEVDERQSAYAVASADIDRAQAALKNAARLVNHCKIRAPFSGTVVEQIASVGDYATAGTPIARLLDTENIELSANVQEQDLPSLEEAKELVFFNRRDYFPVQVRTVLPVMDSRLRSLEVRLIFRDKNPVSGTTGRLQWKSPWPHVSSEYLVRRGGQLGLFLLADGVARFAAMAEAKQGRPTKLALPVNTTVILDGRHGLEDGDSVEPAEPDVAVTKSP